MAVFTHIKFLSLRTNGCANFNHHFSPGIWMTQCLHNNILKKTPWWCRRLSGTPRTLVTKPWCRRLSGTPRTLVMKPWCRRSSGTPRTLVTKPWRQRSSGTPQTLVTKPWRQLSSGTRGGSQARTLIPLLFHSLCLLITIGRRKSWTNLHACSAIFLVHLIC